MDRADLTTKDIDQQIRQPTFCGCWISYHGDAGIRAMFLWDIQNGAAYGVTKQKSDMEWDRCGNTKWGHILWARITWNYLGGWALCRSPSCAIVLYSGVEEARTIGRRQDGDELTRPTVEIEAYGIWGQSSRLRSHCCHVIYCNWGVRRISERGGIAIGIWCSCRKTIRSSMFQAVVSHGPRYSGAVLSPANGGLSIVGQPKELSRGWLSPLDWNCESRKACAR